MKVRKQITLMVFLKISAVIAVWEIGKFIVGWLCEQF